MGAKQKIENFYAKDITLNSYPLRKIFFTSGYLIKQFVKGM
jgi:hypothetical protein